MDLLTPRQRDVVRLLPGRTNVMIGRELQIAERTVKQHIHDAAQRLGCPGRRLRLFLQALKCGEITLSEIEEPPRRFEDGNLYNL